MGSIVWMALARPLDPRRWPTAVATLVVPIVCAGCVLLADPLAMVDSSTRPAATPGRTPRSPARWRTRFCDAQVAVKRALIVIDRTERRLEQDGSAPWFAEVGDDLADLAERGIEFMDVVPAWRPVAPLAECRALDAVGRRPGGAAHREHRRVGALRAANHPPSGRRCAPSSGASTHGTRRGAGGGTWVPVRAASDSDDREMIGGWRSRGDIRHPAATTRATLRSGRA